MILGVHMSLLIGPTLAVPAPLAITEALASVDVTQTDEGRSGFELTFHVARSGPWDLPDYRLLLHPLLRPFNRVIVMVHFNLRPEVLIDGFITALNLNPSEEPGGSTLVVTGEDVSVMMDLEEIAFQLPMTAVAQIATVLAKYSILGWVGVVIDPPPVPDPALPTREIPTQNGTDYEYLQELAAFHGYVFYVRPGPVPNSNIPFWGRQVPLAALPASLLNSALSVNMGSDSNVNSIAFTYNAMAPEAVLGEAVEPTTNAPVPVLFPPISTELPLALVPAAVNQSGRVRVTRPGPASENQRRVQRDQARKAVQTARGLTIPQAYERARARANDSAKEAVTATGELDGLRYGGVLQARSVIGLRGAGGTNDGNYFVKSVTHSISKGEYKQRFTLRREGVGSNVPLVRP